MAKVKKRGISGRYAPKAKKEKESNLARIRKERGYTQAFLADRACLPMLSISKYEMGYKDINKAQAVRLYRLARALRVPMEDLLQKEKIKEGSYKLHKDFWDKLWE